MKFLFLFLFLTTSVYSLEVDEKLTLRILKISESRKTILINRGSEDGLVEGDHAKFYLTVGVVARAVVVKVSPTRSVWSIYRLVNSDYIKEDQVMNLKISTPVKISSDDTRMIVSDDSPKVTMTRRSSDPRDLGIPLAEGAEDLTEDDRLEMKRGEESAMVFKEEAVELKNLPLEIFGLISFSSLSSTTTSDAKSFSYKENSTGFNVGGEYHLSSKKFKSLLKDVSLGGEIAFSQKALMSFSGESIRENNSDFIGFAHYYLKNDFETHSLIPFLRGAIGMGSTKSTFTPGSNSGAGTQEVSVMAQSRILIFGGGVKYNTSKGITLRSTLEFYNRQNIYKEDVNRDIWTKTTKGMNLYLGLGYRF